MARNYWFGCAIAQAPAANRVFAALDDDTGGERSLPDLMGIYLSSAGVSPASHIACKIPPAEDLPGLRLYRRVKQIETLARTDQEAASQALKSFVDQQYSARFPTRTPPSLTICREFVARLVLIADNMGELREFLQKIGLKVIIQ
jgi:hypothetical protein